MATEDPKSKLNQCLQKYMKKPISKNDIVYNTVKHAVGFQATVTLHCLQGQMFAGELSHDSKIAEKSAASQALAANQALFDSLPATTTTKKRPADAAAGGVKVAKVNEDGTPSNPAAEGPKMKLHQAVMKIVRRPLTKGEIAYDAKVVGRAHLASVRIPCLPEPWNAKVWNGIPTPARKDSETSAAEMALAALEADAELSAKMSAPKQGKGAGKSQGKGKGGGKGKWDDWGFNPMMAWGWW
eukprot:gnl/TRDRNA2_/TRDRNA2_35932_c0_seq1.p1 gnl/TRDRNA2_/TRDRNA2_35932_c0~~gnl/TRDRNA2_/TRDRNA2_35932_c0_seq1.p1  ORF type:complete len:241 (-),score=58.22 gnl/TRDRNA2_/TRDRNA2_35932_c0_seq1:193-915(-)